MLVLMSLNYADKLGHFECSVNFGSCFAWTCFGSSSIFAYSKKWIKESVSNFVWKTKLSARTHSECWLWHMVKLPWTHSLATLARQGRKKRAKFGRMWRFCLQFSSIAGAWCIMSSCHKVELSIRNITCKLCAICAKLLHHDNAPAHTSLLVRKFLAKNNTLMMPQPPYSLDLAPCDFFLFPKLKRPMKGRRYATIEEIKASSKEELNKITKLISWSASRIGKNVGTSV